MWEATERVHATGYFAPETAEEAAKVGVEHGWANYFATRAAPLGAVQPAAVLATFFYFAPRRVARFVPAVWEQATPERILEARYRSMDRILRRHLGAVATGPEVRRANELLRRAVHGCSPVGRVLFAGWAALDWPDEPHLGLWHGCTLMREYRSGNHLHALCQHGLDGCESVVSHAAVGGAPEAWIRAEGGWLPDDVDRAIDRLQARGWLDGAGNATEAGHEGRASVERLTDELDRPVWEQLGDEDCNELFAVLSELASNFGPDDQLDWQTRPEAKA